MDIQQIAENVNFVVNKLEMTVIQKAFLNEKIILEYLRMKKT